MTQWKNFLLGTSLLVLISAPVYANPLDEQASPAAAEDALPPKAEEMAVLPDHLLGAPPEILLETAPSAQGDEPLSETCALSAGAMEKTASKVSFFYPFPAAKIRKGDDSIRAESEGGLMLIDGAQYTLKYIEIPKNAGLPSDGVQYSMEARFVHKGVDGSTVILSVPVTEGEANLGIEKMLQNKARVSIDPNDLLPVDRSLALLEQRGGEGCAPAQGERHYVLKTPVYVSAAQIRKFEQLF